MDRPRPRSCSFFTKINDKKKPLEEKRSHTIEDQNKANVSECYTDFKEYDKYLESITENIETIKNQILCENCNCAIPKTPLKRIKYFNAYQVKWFMFIKNRKEAKAGLALELIKKKLRTKKICFDAVAKYGQALFLIPKHLWTDEMVFNACKQDLKVLGNLHKEYLTPKLILSLIRHGASPGIYCYIEQYMLLDYESISRARRARRGSDTQYLYREDCIARLIPALHIVILGSNIRNVQGRNIKFMFI